MNRGQSMNELNNDKVQIRPKYLGLIQNLHNDKLEINQLKLRLKGSIDIDDHGYIPFPDFTFQPNPNHESGIICGMKAIGEHFRSFLNEMPTYINPNSALASCWIGQLQEYCPFGILPEDKPAELDEVINKYHILQSGFGGMNHLCPDIAIGLKLGWPGLLDKIRKYRSINNPVDTEFYDGEELLVLGVIEWIERHVKLAVESADKENDPFKKANYLEIAQVNKNLISKPPETLREACQFIAHFQVIDRMFYAGGALGQLDEILKPYFENENHTSSIEEDEALWYIASVFFNDTHYSQLSGLIPDGSRDITTRISYIILDAMHHLKIPVNLALRVSPLIDNQLLKRSIKYAVEDGYGVAYSLEKGISEGFAKNGYPVELGRQRIKTGCNWVAIPGREYPLQDVTRLNMAMALHYAIEDIKSDEEPNLDTLWNRFTHHIDIMINSIKIGYDKHYEVIQYNTPEIVLNLFMHGPIERGLNCSNGGVDIMNLNIDGIALATVADSFAAIEQRIIKEKRISWARLFELLKTNYEGCESERLMMKNIKRFGDPDSLAKFWAMKIKNYFVKQCKATPTPKHNLMIIPGLFSHGDVYMYGDLTPATPNGRKAGELISHSSEPDPGFAMGLNGFSPSLKANAVALVQPGYGNSAPLHLDIDASMIDGEDGINAIVALIHTHEQMGGTLINLNCISKEKLLKAHEDPSLFPDLIVRVTGYSALFASLSRKYRQQIVDRLLENT